MTFLRDGLARTSSSGNTNVPAAWRYTTADAIAEVVAVDYFLEAIREIGLNDTIYVISSTGGTPAHTITYVNENDGVTIDVVDGLLIPATDT